MNKRLVTVGRKKNQAQGGCLSGGGRRAVQPDFLLILSPESRVPEPMIAIFKGTLNYYKLFSCHKSV